MLLVQCVSGESTIYSTQSAASTLILNILAKVKATHLDATRESLEAMVVLYRRFSPSLADLMVHKPTRLKKKLLLLNLLYNKNTDATSGVSKGPLLRRILDA